MVGRASDSIALRNLRSVGVLDAQRAQLPDSEALPRLALREVARLPHDDSFRLGSGFAKTGSKSAAGMQSTSRKTRMSDAAARAAVFLARARGRLLASPPSSVSGGTGTILTGKGTAGSSSSARESMAAMTNSWGRPAIARGQALVAELVPAAPDDGEDGDGGHRRRRKGGRCAR